MKNFRIKIVSIILLIILILNTCSTIIFAKESNENQNKALSNMENTSVENENSQNSSLNENSNDTNQTSSNSAGDNTESSKDSNNTANNTNNNENSNNVNDNTNNDNNANNNVNNSNNTSNNTNSDNTNNSEENNVNDLDKNEAENESKNEIENETEEKTEDIKNENNESTENNTTDDENISNEVTNQENSILSLDLQEKTVKKSYQVTYRTHVQNFGWQDYVSDGELSGTQERSLRLEAININLGEQFPNLNIKYQVHAQSIGWQEWKENGEMAGTEGRGLRLEAIRIKLETTDDYSVRYRAYIQNIGWQDWKEDGEIAGTEGESLRLEAIEIQIIKKEKRGLLHIDSPENGSTLYSPKEITVSGWKMSNVHNSKIEAYLDDEKLDSNKITYKARQDVIDAITGYGTSSENQTPGFEFSIDAESLEETTHNIKIFLLSQSGEQIQGYQLTFTIDNDLHVEYKTHVQNFGWQDNVYDGNLSGTEGRALRLEAINIDLKGAPSDAKILYRTQIQNIGWQEWKQGGELSGTEGQGLRLEAIQIKLQNMDEYTVEYQVHIQGNGWSDWYIDGETAGTVGEGKRLEAIRIRLVPKYKREYHGIDVSQFNGTIDWNSVKNAGIDYVYIRVGYRGYGQAGNFREDSKFRTNIEGAKNAGIPVGVYFVTQAITPEEAIEEANWVYNIIKDYKIDYPVALDIEEAKVEPGDIPRTINLDNATRTYLAKLFCQTIQNYGYTPIIYTNLNWANNKLNMSELSEFDTWIARYRDINLGPGYNGDYTMWQYTSEGSISGISGYVDFNICYKTY